MMKKLISVLLLLFAKCSVYAQNTDKFIYLEKDSSEIKIDIASKEFNKLLSIKKAIIYCNIYERNLNPPEAHRKEIEGWLSPYNASKFHTCFSVFNIESNDGFNVNFVLSTQSEKFSRLKRSNVFVLTKDTIIIKELLKNGKDLSIFDVFSFQNKNNETIKLFELVDIRDFSDFQWKTNQLIYNLDQIKMPEKKVVIVEKKNFFQLGYSSNATLKNKKFNSISSNQIDLLVKGSFGHSNLGVFGGGISIAQNKFSTSSNLQYSEAGSLPLDSIYASLTGVSENYIHQTINIAFLIAIRTKSILKNGFFEFSFSPFISIQSKLSSTVTGGSIKTYGFNNQINEYLYDIPELGLKTQTNEILNVQNSFKTGTFGFNAGFSYNIKLGPLTLAPNINLKLISIHNKNPNVNAYSISENKFNGVFASYRKNSNILMPTIGLSISF